eukprot:XP_011608566.1 PREDICTED: antigen peptide transporter 2-like [Takifugu rubripes]
MSLQDRSSTHSGGQMKAKEVVVYGISVLLFDTLLSLAFLTGLVLLQFSGCGGLSAQWAFAVVKWAFLQGFTWFLTDANHLALLSRLAALLCLLSPVHESVQLLAAPPSEPYTGPWADLGRLLLVPAVSLVSCVVWEMGFCSNAGVKTSSKPLDSRRLLLRMLKYFKPDALYIIAAFTFLILAVVCETLIPLYQGKVIDMLKGEALHSSFYGSIWQLTLVCLGSTLFSGLRGGTFMCTLSRLNSRMKHLLFGALLQQDVHFFENNDAGSLSSRLQSDVDKMGRTVALNANAMVRSSVRTCLMLGVMVHLSWELTLLTCIEIPLMALMQNKYIKLSTIVKKQIQDGCAETESLALQTMKGIQVVRSFRAEQHETRRYREALARMQTLRRRKGLYGYVYGLGLKMLNLGIKMLMLLYARRLISTGYLSTGALLSFFLYQKPIFRSLSEILYSFGDTLSTVEIISTVFGYLDRRPQCKEEGDLAPEKLEGRIVFQNVTFSYPSAATHQKALKSVSMEIAGGKLTALVGPSGSGKTSCLSLLKRLYEAQEGEILLDGKPLHHYKRKYLHQKLALVSQDLELFSGSLRYNIEYGLKDCTFEKVIDAAKKAKADAFLSELMHQYDTEVRGCGTLSSGLRHSIALIRALVRDPQVLILDETTSKVDANVWHAVLREVLSGGGTVLLVAHNLKSVETADRIIFIENGEVLEEGTHPQLMAKRGRYHHFHNIHFQHSTK